MGIETAFIFLFILAMAAAVAARRLRAPYTVVLVLTGLVLGALNLFPAPHLTKGLLFSVILPGLLFEAAFNLDARELRNSWITITTLAVPGVIASMVLVALALSPATGALTAAPGFDWKYALVFGALIAATDPVAVVALFRSIGAPRRLTTLLEGESLLNDGTAIVFFTLSLALVTGTGTTGGALLLQFFSSVGGGALIGMVTGAAASFLMRRLQEPMIEITLTTVAAYGSFVAGESLHSSGVIATVVCGMLCGNLGASPAMTAATRAALGTFWEYLTFALNSIVFLLIGFEVRLSNLLHYWLPILFAYCVVTLSRAAILTTGHVLLGWSRERIPWRWSVVLTWGGLRGALAMVLALSLPQDFAYRDLIVSMTFGVALLSILLQGLTMSPLLVRLGIVGKPADRVGLEVRRGRIQAAEAALAEIDRLSHQNVAAPQLLDELRAEYRQIISKAERELRELGLESRPATPLDLREIRLRILGMERERVMRAYRQGQLRTASRDTLLADIDTRLSRLERMDQSAAVDPSSSRENPPA
ncbi:MAG TPA: sodium:proton antiporter [Steroidobacteraceae bacterium]|nr:sodium:proton antiporter [Steroidobacteraceae bacterium]